MLIERHRVRSAVVVGTAAVVSLPRHRALNELEFQVADLLLQILDLGLHLFNPLVSWRSGFQLSQPRVFLLVLEGRG